ncbi:hypothetical protein [Pontibacter beigongshangensis]|uniref:hypothetical protein n=1 Tax=Pontibacter beigongshangensis TaxID=2574733 RepID=UPI00164F321D|nr:hypothetical protein [Pontibacter beigongshangensis]
MELISSIHVVFYKQLSLVMIIYNNLIKLEYNPVTDILLVEWPDIFDYASAEMKQTLQAIVDTIKHYDVKKLLIDSRKSIIGISQAEYEALLKEFNKDLTNTRLQKIARLESENLTREAQVKELLPKLKQKTLVDFGTFASITEATNWLER